MFICINNHTGYLDRYKANQPNDQSLVANHVATFVQPSSYNYADRFFRNKGKELDYLLQKYVEAYPFQWHLLSS